MLLSVEAIITKTFAHLHSYCRCVELIYQIFLKSGRRNYHCNNVFRPKKITATSFCSSLSEETQVSNMTTAASRKTRLDANIIGRCQGDDTFVAFQPMGIFRFCRNGNSFVPKGVYKPLYFSRSPPTTLSSLLLCACVQFSRDSIRAFNDRIKTRENGGL